MNPRYWQGRRVFVTGHTGFKGSWLCLLLQSLGAEVKGYALAPQTRPNLFEDAEVASGMASQFGDINDLATLQRSLSEFAPHTVFHLAAQAIVSESYDDPLQTLQTNILGTANVLEAIRGLHETRVMVIVTTDKCYDMSSGSRRFTESDALGGSDPYSASKACAEIVSAAYRQSFFGGRETAIATARAGNVVGGGDWASNRLVPDIMRAFSAGDSALIRNPGSVRPWQHVLEPLSGYLLLAERLAHSGDFSQAWNFGPVQDDARPASWLADQLRDYWPEPAEWHSSQQAQTFREAPTLELDSSRARELLGWQPQYNLDSALRLITDWYSQYFQGADAGALTRAQIKSFLAAQEQENGTA